MGKIFMLACMTQEENKHFSSFGKVLMCNSKAKFALFQDYHDKFLSNKQYKCSGYTSKICPFENFLNIWYSYTLSTYIYKQSSK